MRTAKGASAPNLKAERITLTKSMAEVLRILDDADGPMMTSTDTRKPAGPGRDGWINGTTAAALARRGWASYLGDWPKYSITDEGRVALRMWESQEEARRKPEAAECTCAGPDYHPDKPCAAHPKAAAK